jgi:hypothetical protein
MNEPCPICHLTGGFHDASIHHQHEVSPELTWKPGEEPVWRRDDH